MTEFAITHFHPQSSAHRPRTTVRLQANATGIAVAFEVTDQFVRCVHARDGTPVCKDACVEWFVSPKAGRGYFNFETNCGGGLLLGYHEPGASAIEPAHTLTIEHSLPAVIDPEITGPVTWCISYFVPFEFFENIVGPLDKVWRMNFYKCASNNSHPHWAAWSPIGAKLSFHRPESFGVWECE